MYNFNDIPSSNSIKETILFKSVIVEGLMIFFAILQSFLLYHSIFNHRVTVSKILKSQEHGFIDKCVLSILWSDRNKN